MSNNQNAELNDCLKNMIPDGAEPTAPVSKGLLCSMLFAVAQTLGFNTVRAYESKGYRELKDGDAMLPGCVYLTTRKIIGPDDGDTFGKDRTVTGKEIFDALHAFYYGFGKADYVGGAPLSDYGLPARPFVTFEELAAVLSDFCDFCKAQFRFASYIHKGINVDRYFQGYPDTVDQKTGMMDEEHGRNTRFHAIENHPYRQIHDFGYDHIRLPTSPRDIAYVSEKGELTLSEDAFSVLDESIRLANENGLRVVLDFHSFTWDDVEITDVPGFRQEEFLTLWRLMAERYRSWDPNWLAYEIFNEPCGLFQKDGVDEEGEIIDPEKHGAAWNGYQHTAYDLLRSVDPDKTIIFGTIHCNLIDAADYLDISYAANDCAKLLSIHNYVPHSFTMIWGKQQTYEPFVGWQSDEKIEQMEKYQKENGILIWMSEFGIWRSRDQKEAEKYYDHIALTLNRCDISFCLWDLDAFSNAFDNDTMTFRPFTNGLLCEDALLNG